MERAVERAVAIAEKNMTAAAMAHAMAAQMWRCDTVIVSVIAAARALAVEKLVDRGRAWTVTELGEQLVEAAQILLSPKRTTPSCWHQSTQGREPNTGMRIVRPQIIDEIHAHRWGRPSVESKSLESS